MVKTLFDDIRYNLSLDLISKELLKLKRTNGTWNKLVDLIASEAINVAPRKRTDIIGLQLLLIVSQWTWQCLVLIILRNEVGEQTQTVVAQESPLTKCKVDVRSRWKLKARERTYIKVQGHLHCAADSPRMEWSSTSGQACRESNTMGRKARTECASWKPKHHWPEIRRLIHKQPKVYLKAIANNPVEERTDRSRVTDIDSLLLTGFKALSLLGTLDQSIRSVSGISHLKIRN